MKYYQTTILVLFLLIVSLSSCQTHTKPNSEELISSIETFNTAFAEGNLTVLDSMTTKNYLHTNGSSKVIGKTDWFNYLKRRNKDLESGVTTVLEYGLDETKIEYHGNVAIVTGRVTVITKDSVVMKKNQYRITNLWIYEEERWKRAGFHDGRIE